MSTNKHSEYVMLIALPGQQWLGDRASLLRYTYLASVVKSVFYSYCIRLSVGNTVHRKHGGGRKNR
jgi:hypothetical protein